MEKPLRMKRTTYKLWESYNSHSEAAQSRQMEMPLVGRLLPHSPTHPRLIADPLWLTGREKQRGQDEYLTKEEPIRQMHETPNTQA